MTAGLLNVATEKRRTLRESQRVSFDVRLNGHRFRHWSTPSGGATLRLKEENRYRTFVDLERIARRHLAFAGRPSRGDYLVFERLPRHEPERGRGPGDGGHGNSFGYWFWRHPQHRRNEPSLGGAGTGTRRFARQAGGAGVYVRLCRKPIEHFNDRKAHSELPDPFG